MSRPIRKFIAFSSPLLLGIPPVDHRNFSGKITKQSAVRLADQHNHEISIVEVSGTQKSAQVELPAKAGAYFGCHYRNREIADNFYNTQNAIYFPNKPARGNSPGLAGRYLSHSPVFQFLYDPDEIAASVKEEQMNSQIGERIHLSRVRLSAGGLQLA